MLEILIETETGYVKHQWKRNRSYGDLLCTGCGIECDDSPLGRASKGYCISPNGLIAIP